MLSKIKTLYEDNYKLLLIIPFTLLILALCQIGIQTAQTGDFVHKGVSLSGGSTITIPTSSTSVEDLEFVLQNEFPTNELSVRALGSTGLIVESTIQDTDTLKILSQTVSTQTNVQISELTTEVMGSSLGESFFKQTMIALLIAFLLMGLVVFLYFRTIIPSLAVILAAASDIIITVAIFNLTGMKLQTAGIAALLMLIGYSVDSDILVTTLMIKRRTEAGMMKRIYNAMKTGLTMSATTLVVLIVTLILVKSEVVKQIVIILIIGILVDQIMTWIQNVGLLRLHLEAKGEDYKAQRITKAKHKTIKKMAPIKSLKPSEQINTVSADLKELNSISKETIIQKESKKGEENSK